jgi:hypothetical protein
MVVLAPKHMARIAAAGYMGRKCLGSSSVVAALFSPVALVPPVSPVSDARRQKRWLTP